MSLTATEGPPELDNLYLDMNGIIHNCTHGNDPNMKLTEDEMILRIFAYLDKLIQLVRPKKLVFMAIDGEWRRHDGEEPAGACFQVGSHGASITDPGPSRLLRYLELVAPRAGRAQHQQVAPHPEHITSRWPP
jgi:hypothetical protein